MRITSEYIPDTNALLVRLLGPNIEIGTYLIDGTPQIPVVQEVEVFNSQIQNDEIDLYFYGYYPYPKKVTVTTPSQVFTVSTEDSLETSVLATSILHKGEEILASQPAEVVEQWTTAPELHFGESAEITRGVEVQIKPVLPKYWFSLNFERPDPLMLGDDITSDGLVYQGGVAGRVLNFASRQPHNDAAPWLSSAPLKVEGSYSNELPNNAFYPTESRLGFFDKVPVNWLIATADQDSLVRVQADSGGIAPPTLTLSYTPRPDSAVFGPAAIVQTPTVASNKWFQTIVTPGTANERGFVQLQSANGLATTANIELTGPTLLRLNVGSDAGRVKIVWSQEPGIAQILQIIAPSVSSYESSHSWIPAGTNESDIISIENMSSSNWYFENGILSMTSQVEEVGMPVSWEITSGSNSFLKLENGNLSSDFSATTINLAAVLSSFPNKGGTYTLSWTEFSSFKLIADNGITSVSLPFSLTVPSIVNPVSFTIKSFSPTAGTAIVRAVKFSPS